MTTGQRRAAPTVVFLLTTLAMLAFAGNSLLCRLALRQAEIDAATFTAVRIISGAAMLWLIIKARPRSSGGSWHSALALFGYAAAFSFAYTTLSAGTGAILLFAAVQATMIGAGLSRGERLIVRQWAGVVIAFAGLVLLLLPGIAAPPLSGALLMIAAGMAWGIYSLRGKGVHDPLTATAGNFARALPFAFALLLVLAPSLRVTPTGLAYALASGAITSGMGYVIWYSALVHLTATGAATVQLSAPVIAAIGGVLLLAEPVTLQLVIASVAVLGGIGLVVWGTPRG